MMEFLLVLAGGIIGFISSIGIIIVQEWRESHVGELKIYRKIINIENHKGFGTLYDNNRMVFMIPLKIQFQNTSKKARLIRDFKLILYKGNEYVADMVQIEGSSKERSYGESDGCYSFVIEPESIKEVKCLFAFKIEQSQQKAMIFDRANARFFDEKDNRIEYKLFENMINPWSNQLFDVDEDWIELN